MITLSIKQTIAEGFYSICEGISRLITWLFNLLPDNPFENISVPAEVSNTLGHLNHFLPIKAFIVVIGGWLLCIIAMMIYRVILGFFKLVGGAV